ncbi:sensor histidine kinase [Clostridium botulinum]|nr:HAMP domain-containing sensor histidine kinase [Clostridium botulinum]AEB76199.1 putative phosphate regulon sensor protein [Clostridium botulinum BKT015925]KEH98241.1 phosphate regulon sensor protein [Clostridium botulinum D str. 16868]KEI04935.1 phosphate regulon sensor protein [Clostridium botulinum C/D str. Sp77]MCD3196775.1 HAMP domain-containing histidine kinase [Clostridium botulinum C/D]MCD3201622.1 HAMP domain-containing histidine kinase [Clostridium botulinum C/D]
MSDIKMKTKIMIAIVSTLILSIILIIPVHILIVNYQHEDNIKKNLNFNNNLTQKLIEDNAIKNLDEYFKAFTKSDIRITLLDNNYKLVKDSNANLEEKDECNFRKDIVDSYTRETLYSIRYSDLLKDSIIYCATKCNAGYIISSMPIGKVVGFGIGCLKYYLIVLMLAFVVALIFSSKLANIIVKPIKDLKFITSRIARGDLDRRVDIKSNDELGELSKTFNDMADKLQNTLNIKSQFVANVSHELKTPLTSIKGFAETLRYVENNSTRDRFLGIIDDEVERLTRLINDILILSDIECNKYLKKSEDIDVVACIKDIYNLMKNYSEKKNIHVNMVVYESPIICGDKDKFKEMIINIVDNAIKYSENGDQVFIGVKTEENQCVIWVEDTGVGIEKEHIPRLFERFYRVDKARSRNNGGTGLGLAIVKHIVLNFNGKIYVRSKFNQGTKFTIKIPLK